VFIHEANEGNTPPEIKQSLIYFNEITK